MKLGRKFTPLNNRGLGNNHSQQEGENSGSTPETADTFILSKKRKELFKQIVQEFAFYKFDNNTKQTAEQRTRYILDLIEQQDREFIKRLKGCLHCSACEYCINELSGEDLVK